MYSAAMRVTRIALVSLALPFALACSSSTAGTATDPAIRIEQFPSTEFTAKQEGAVSIAYQITVLNRSSEPIRLRRLEMQALARSPYSLRNTPVTFDQMIAPGKEEVVTFSMWGYPQAERSSTAKLVTIHGVAYFQNAAGTFQREFTQSFREPASTQ